MSSMKIKNLSLQCLNINQIEPTIKTLLSAKQYATQVITGDITNSDKLKVFCSDNKIKYVKLSIDEGFSKCQNELMNLSDKTWHIHLFPGEIIKNVDKIE